MVSQMPLSRYQCMSLIANVMYVYTIYKYLKVFFDGRRTKAIVEVLSYFAFYCCLAIVMIFFNRPIINLIFSCISYYVLSLNYSGNLKSRMMAVLSMYITILCTELIVSILCGYFNINELYGQNEFSSIAGLFACRILCFIIVLVFENYQHIKKGVEIPNSSWIMLLFIPMGSFFIIFNIILISAERIYAVAISLVVLLGINIVTFHLYGAMNEFYESKIQRLLLQQQNENYLKQMEAMNNSYESVRSVRHDIKNHLIAVETYVKQDNKESALQYIHKIIDASYGDKSFVSTGNIEIDSILNYKLEIARSKSIEVDLDIKIPTKLNIDTLDIVGMLGNLIDNAINACLKLEEGRKISLCLKYSKSLFFITVKNTFNGKVVYLDNKIATTHRDKEKHGIGLNNVNSIVKKYDGTMEIVHEDKIFVVNILMYLN